MTKSNLKGKHCVKCGTRYLLTRHHTEQPYLNRFEKTDKKTIILCQTCHYEEDFEKNLACYHKAVWKRYNELNRKKGIFTH